MANSNITIRLGKAATEYNVGVSTIVDFLHRKGFNIDSNPNTKLGPEMQALLKKEYQPDIAAKDIAKHIELFYQESNKQIPEIKNATDEMSSISESMLANDNSSLVSGSANNKIFGTIIGITSTEIIVNIGYRSDIKVPVSKLQNLPNLNIGDKMEIDLSYQNNIDI